MVSLTENGNSAWRTTVTRSQNGSSAWRTRVTRSQNGSSAWRTRVLRHSKNQLCFTNYDLVNHNKVLHNVVWLDIPSNIETISNLYIVVVWLILNRLFCCLLINATELVFNFHLRDGTGRGQVVFKRSPAWAYSWPLRGPTVYELESFGNKRSRRLSKLWTSI